jgi:hypothetical protein
MFVKRSVTWDTFDRNWCPTCAETTEMEPIRTGLPGIATQKCPICKHQYQANFLEDGEDLLEVPDELKFEEV